MWMYEEVNTKCQTFFKSGTDGGSRFIPGKLFLCTHVLRVPQSRVSALAGNRTSVIHTLTSHFAELSGLTTGNKLARIFRICVL
jgi:hypothetical protein